VREKLGPKFNISTQHTLESTSPSVSTSMPLNATTYLSNQGWKGKGTSLDGPNGNGLKKPLIITQKKNLGGVGNDRDRATEWWDCLFEVSTKITLFLE